MTQQRGQFMVKAGPIVAIVVGGGPIVISTATLALGIGAAVAVAAVGWGVYNILSRK